jgi:hypothetical protein
MFLSKCLQIPSEIRRQELDVCPIGAEGTHQVTMSTRLADLDDLVFVGYKMF